MSFKKATDYELCAKARQILSSMAPTIAKARGTSDREAAVQALVTEYIGRNFSINQTTWEEATPFQKKEYINKALAECVLQLYAVSEVGEDAKSQRGTDFNKMIKVERAIVKIQAMFRQKLAVRRLEKEVEKQKARLAKKLNKRNVSNEEIALSELKSRLRKKGLTPEAFFRVCDTEMKRSVPVDRFKSMLNNFKLELSRGQISRLALILDEDMEGFITLEEYYNALEAYGQHGEDHSALDGTGFYVPFEHKAVFKLLQILKDRTITPDQLFRSCDVDGSGSMSVNELEQVLPGFSAEFYQKDCQAIHNFFDIDKNNSCSQAEFMGQINKAERLFQQHKQRLAGGRSLGPGTLRSEGFNDRDGGMAEFIPGWYDMTPSVQTEKLSEYMIQLFKQRNFSPARVYAMADTSSTGSAKLSSLLSVLGKLMSNLTKEFLDHIPPAYDMSYESTVSKEEWMFMFDYKQALKDVGPTPTAAKRMNDSKKKKADKEGNMQILKYFSQVMKKENLTPERLFRQIDPYRSGVGSTEDLKQKIKLILPDMQTINIKKLMNAITQDLDQTSGVIEEQEFISLMEQAARSNVDTSEFNRITDALASSGKKPKQEPKLQSKKTVAFDQGGVGISLDKTVHPDDRVTHEQVYACFTELYNLEKEVEEPVDEIQEIFEKIKVWKQKAGDLEEQEQMVHQALKPKTRIKIHNYNTVLAKLEELKSDIDLTDQQIKIIIYCSLNHDYLTNMIVAQGKFLKWFTINFEGEGGEELDFLAGLNNNWTAACCHAMDIIQQYKLLKDNHDIIFTEKWWGKLRFSNFGTNLKREMEQAPHLMQDMRTMFRNHNDKLSYFDFFQFIKKKLKINLEDWEEDALEMRLDRLGMAFIEFNELNEFSRAYNLSWGEPVLDTDMEAILEAKINQSYKDYKLSQADYFEGCQTMLTNEKAALNVARQIYKDLKKKKKDRFIDQDFGPKDKADMKGSAHSLYPDGEIPQKGYIDPQEVEWVYAEELCDPGEYPQFLDNSAAAEDCIQGDLGDCWLISAMAAIAQRDELVIGGRSGLEYDPDMIVDKEIAVCLSKGVFPPIFHKYRAKGLYVLRIFKNFKWIYVIVDERLPVKKGTKGKSKEPIFGACRSPHEMWVALLEKAYAKMHGCYGNLISGYIDEGIQELTGFQSEKVIIRDERTGLFPHKMIKHYIDEGEDVTNGFFNFLEERHNDQCLMGCSIKGYGKSGELIIDGLPTGLILNHAYTILDVIQLPDPQDPKDPIKLLRVRNPWGDTEWKGEWSEGSQMYKKFQSQLQDYVDTLHPEEQFDVTQPKNDGSFFIEYNDWKDIFSTLFINLDFPDKWTGVRFDSQWTESNSGGLPCTNTKDAKEQFAKNPQFMIKPTSDTEMLVSMSQTGGRLPVKKRGQYQYYKYPFPETLNYACLSIFKVDMNAKYLTEFDKNRLIYLSPVKRERENTGRVRLKGGQTYIMVPSCEVAGTLGDVFINIYIDQALRECLIKRVFHPKDKNTANDEILPHFIPEEAEKIQHAPTWKRELVREMLPFMITGEDELQGKRDWGAKCDTD